MPAVSDYSPLDRAYVDQPAYRQPKLEDPIIGIERIGQTVPEQDPATGANILQNVQAAIRRGVGNIQLVMSTSPDAAIGGRFKAYGKEVREEIRSVLEANKVKMTSIELPTAISNLSGYDPQQGGFNDQRRERDMQEVRDAIRFAAEVAGGGGVDVLSWEFDRSFTDAPWNKKKDGTLIFESPGGPDKEVVQVVDEVTGRISAFRKGEKQFLPYDPKKFDPTKPAEEWSKQRLGDDEKGLPGLKEWVWSDFVAVAQRAGQKPSELFIKIQQNAQISSLRGYAAYYNNIAEKEERQYRAQISEFERQSSEFKNSEDGRRIRAELSREQESLQRTKDLAASQLQQARALEETSSRLVDIGEFAVDRATESYAEAGMAARMETHNKQLKGNPIHVGPELGWPTFYGSHPEEFVNIIKKARVKMAEELVQKEKLSRSEAETEAKTHIKGVLDTSHLGMFFQNFMPHEADTDLRTKEFNKWFIEQINNLADENAKHDLIGGIQLVDSQSGAHGHLPPGQGIFPVIEAGNIMVKRGNYKGYLTSEGHEEEKFQSGRIVLETWKNFDPNIMGIGGFGGGGMPSMRWADVHQGYFGKPYSPMFIFGDYAPSQEYRLWSEMPLE